MGKPNDNYLKIKWHENAGYVTICYAHCNYRPQI